MATEAKFGKRDPATVSLGGGGQILSSAGAGGAPIAPSTSPSTPSTPQRATPNIQQYLRANVGAGEQIAGGIQSGVQQQAGKAAQQLSTYEQNLERQYQPLQETQEKGREVIQTAFQNPQELLDAYQASQTSPQTADPNALRQYSQFQSYNNPYASGGFNQQIAGYGSAGQAAAATAQQQQQALQQQANAANTEMGRFGLLQQTFGRPTYNIGQQTLDALFLQAQPGAANQLRQGLGGIARGFGQQATEFSGDISNRLSALQRLSAQNQNLIKTQFGQGLGDIAGNVRQEYEALQQSAPALQEQLKQGILENKLTAEQLQQLGMAPGTHTYGLSGEDILRAGQFTANPLAAFEQGGAAQAATPEEFARYNALNQLAGGGPGQSLQTSIFGGAQQTGYTPVSFSPETLQSAIETRRQGLQTDLKAQTEALATALGSVRGAMSPEGAYRVQAFREALGRDLAQNQLNPNQYMATLAALEPYLGAGYAPVQAYQNFYNTSYNPAMAAVLGEVSPDTKPLPKDWQTGVKPPMGK